MVCVFFLWEKEKQSSAYHDGNLTPPLAGWRCQAVRRQSVSRLLHKNVTHESLFLFWHVQPYGGAESNQQVRRLRLWMASCPQHKLAPRTFADTTAVNIITLTLTVLW